MLCYHFYLSHLKACQVFQSCRTHTKKLKWICCYLNDILPNKHTIILTLFAKIDEITAYKWVCCHLKNIVNIVFCFHFFLENISMRQKNWAAGLSEDFSFTTRVRLGLSIVKNIVFSWMLIPKWPVTQVCDWLVTLFLSLLLAFQLSYQYWWQFRKNPCK